MGHAPAAQPDRHARQLFQDLSAPQTGLIARIQKNATAQETGKTTALGGTQKRAARRSSCADSTAPPPLIAESTGKPPLMDKFRMPHGTNAQKLVIAARAIAGAAEPMATDFVAYGHEPTLVGDLLAHASKAPNRPRTLAHKTRPGPPPSSSRCCTKRPQVEQLDAFLHNFYRSNGQAMGEWKTASHVERQPKKRKPEPKEEK